MGTRTQLILALILVPLILVACTGVNKMTLEQQKNADIDALRKEVLAQVEDKPTAEKLSALISQLQSTLSAAEQVNHTLKQDWAKLNSDYHAKPEQFEDLFEAYNVDAEYHQKMALQLRIEIASLLSADEWRTLARKRKIAQESSLQSLNTKGQ